MSVGTKIEDKILSVIEECCQTKKDTTEALKYFENTLVNELIEEATDDMSLTDD